MVDKNAELDFNISSTSTQSIMSNIRFSTQDEGTAKLTFNLFKDGVTLPLNAVNGKLAMRMADGSKFVKTVTIVDKVKGIAEYILTTEELKHYGKVNAELYLNYDNNQKMSVHRFSFVIEQSLIDADIAVDTEFYVDDFYTMKEAIETIAAETQTNVDLTKEKADEIISLINENDVAKKSELQVTNAQLATMVPKTDIGTISLFKATGTNLIDKVSNEFTQRGINILWLGADPLGVEDSWQAIQDSIEFARENGIGEVYVPAGDYRISKPLIVYSFIAIRGIHRLKAKFIPIDDFPAITTEGYNSDSVGASEIFLEKFSIVPINMSSKTSYSIEMINTYNTHIRDVLIDEKVMSVEDVGGVRFSKKASYEGNHFVNKIHDCQLRQASIVMESTDSYIERNEVWAYARSFGIHLVKSSQFLTKNQIVGSKVNGGIWVKDTKDNYDIELIRIIDNFLDGSYDGIDSGVGLKAEKMRNSKIIANDFWRQMDQGIRLINCHSTNVIGNVFENNNRRDNSSDDILLEGCAAIPVTGNTHKQEFSRTNKGAAIKTVNSDGNKNIIKDNTVYYTSNYKESSFSNKDIVKDNNGIKDRTSLLEAYVPLRLVSTVGAETRLVYSSRVTDYLNEYDYTNGVFIAADRGRYNVSASITFDELTVGTRIYLMIFKNGVGYRILQSKISSTDVETISGAITIPLEVGETASVYYYTSAACKIEESQKETWLSIAKMG